MKIAELQRKFAMPGLLALEKTASGLIVARVTTPAAEATIYMQGAHLTHWKPAGQAPAIFLSHASSPADFVRRLSVVVPWAWAATLSPSIWASSTMALISS